MNIFIRTLKLLRLPRYRCIYVLRSPDFQWRAKIGISDDHKVRLDQITDSITHKIGRKATVYVFWAMPVLFATKHEAILHRIFRRFNTRTVPGSGYTEWFWSVNWITSLLAYYSIWHLDKAAAWGCFIALVPLPIDYAACVLALAVVEYALTIGLIYVLFKFVMLLYCLSTI